MNENYIMVSGDNEKHLKKIDSLNGVVMLNLEDGVRDKSKALENIEKVLETNPNRHFFVRVNSLDNGGIEEIKVLDRFANLSFRIPKIEFPEELEIVYKITSKKIGVSIETKESFFNLRKFNHPQIKTFYLGILDLFDELHFSHDLITFENKLIDKILIDFSLNVAYLEKIAVGFVYQHYKNLDSFRRWCQIQKNYGFKGVGTITPAQLEIANEIFEEENIEYAKMIVERFEKEGPFVIDGLYVDEPIYKNYKQRSIN